MESDGNIRYANYQSEEQVIEFLNANGFGEETYGDWFGGGASGSVGGSVVAVAADSVSIMPLAPQIAIDPFQAEMFG